MKNKKMIIVLVCLACTALLFGILYVAVQGIHYAAVAEAFDVSKEDVRDDGIVVMNYNVRCVSVDDFGTKSWFYRADMIIDQIREVAPDVISFQEVSPVHQKYLQKNLVGYNCVIKYRDNAINKESTPIYYRADRFDLIEEDSFWLSETPDEMSKGWGAACYRICSCAVLKEKASNKNFVVFNTHLDHVSEEARIKGIDLVLSKIAEHGGYPAILTGDMNDYEGSVTYNKAVANFLDSKYVADTTMHSITYNGYGREPNSPDSPIDFCFVSKEGIAVDSYKVLNYQVDGKYLSDHYALVVKLELI